MIKSLVTAGFLLVSVACLSQQEMVLRSRTDSIEYIKSRMREDGRVTTYAVGVHGNISVQYLRFLYLLQTLNLNESLELAKDSSACLRVYGYAALDYRHYKEIKKIKSLLMQDTSLVPMLLAERGGKATPKYLIRTIHFYNRKSIQLELASLSTIPIF
ncbi:MAG TPA: hypothetical protein VKR53_10515 [Puia sp.]|nr:hypothetical protein [Puia sp.]